MDDFANEICERFERPYALVREHLGTAAQRAKKHYDLRVRSTTFQPGDRVWIYCPRRKVGRTSKWARYYSGPYSVEHVFSDVLYRVRKDLRSKPFLVHVDKMKPYEDVDSETSKTEQPVAPTADGQDERNLSRPRRHVRPPARFRE